MRTPVFISQNRIGRSLILLLLLSACTKIEPEIPENGSPVFFANGYWEQTPFSLKAGEADVFMFTDFTLDSAVFQFEGALKKTCAGCNEALIVKIRNYKATTDGSNLNMDSAFYKGDYVFYNRFPKAITRYGVQFQSFSTGIGMASHAWGFGDGTFATIANPYKIYDEGKVYNVTYVVSYTNGCTTNISYEVNTKTNKNARFTAIPIDTNTFDFSADSVATLSVWTFGDSTTGTGNTISHSYAAPGTYKVCLAQTRGAETFTSCQNITVNLGNVCKANFNFTSTPIVDPGNLHLSEVTVEWVDENGETYSSALTDQESNSYFRLLESSNYLPNARQQRTRRFEFETHCRVSNGSQIKTLNQVKGIMAVGMP